MRYDFHSFSCLSDLIVSLKYMEVYRVGCAPQHQRINSLHAGLFFSLFCRLQIFFSKSTFSKNYFRYTIRVSNSWYLDQDRRFCRPYLVQNCL